ncbi:unnamed protein product [Didymodactylos carnosus]|uniref:PAZ domain-containing protein n=1 Tax=Didymodactylos carnosus TaxID=1234261 RepID=A0A8S2E2M7_9BILA|nr:unnamed protein product [Didymodactylos carnosus]CAF3888358.1 unnamed protein product [Didymodactylos carnosus]
MACALSTPPLLSNNNNSTERQRDDDVTSDRPNGKQQRRFIPVTSAIPDIPHGFVLSLPPRPEQSGIIKESEQMIYVNHFSCQLKQNLNLYQYDVCVEQANRKPQNDQWHEVKGREKCKTFFYLLLNEKCLPSTNVWYDEGKCLYSTERFEPVIITTKQNVQLRFNIKAQSGMWNTQDIYDYINGRTSQYPFDAVRIIETLLKKSIHHLIHVEHNTCYFTNQKPSILDGGFEEYRGFVQMLNLAKERISLILQTKLTTFYPTVDMLEFIENYLGTITLRPSDYKQLANVLDGVKVSTIQSNHTQIYWIKRFGDVPGNIYLDDDLTRPNVTQYYAEEKGIKLKYPQLKCLEVYFLNEYTNPKFLPLEVCRLTPWQIYDHEVDSKQRRMTEAQRPKKSIPNPEERYKAIMSSLQTCNYNNKQNNLCQAIGFQINDQEMPKVKTRILPKPQITNGSQQRREQAEIRFGNIQLNGHLFQPKPIIKLSLVHFGQFNDAKKNLLTNFTNSFFGILKKFGMPHPQLKIWKLDDTQNEIEEFFVEQKRLNPDVIICVLESDIKASVKYCATVTHVLNEDFLIKFTGEQIFPLVFICT